ncbi:hypothetical protein J31TS4_45780 [Paenibacillus sp. J31TS4]|uniref:NADPH-dependent F420 reductase n=1 Tax=Paenibacillus sp. J31TS4 TaxID=2807195 RepID=UPI001B06FA7B|nr:NAD(P)-binding domain-containing protein [Paenibacillus sp. J31TS4]GIP41298.1 hypothetical protein J31TS4_45780 [Paenibacillus sp. J31TS4]
MRVSILGTGRMGTGLVRVLGEMIPDLQWGSRSLAKVRQKIRETEGISGLIQPVTNETALEAEVIFPTFWYRDLLPWAAEHKSQLSGKILVDIANPFTSDFTAFTLDWGTSAAEELQRLLPETKVVGAFKNTFFSVLEQPLHQGLTSDVFVTSDHEEAKACVMALLQGIPFRVLDGGGLQNNRTLERMTLFEREVALRYGSYPYVSFRLFGMGTD